MTLATDQYSSELSSAKMGCCKKTRKGFNQTTIGLVRQPAQPVKCATVKIWYMGYGHPTMKRIDGGGMTHPTIPQHGYLIQLLTMEHIWFFLKIVYPKPHQLYNMFPIELVDILHGFAPYARPFNPRCLSVSVAGTHVLQSHLEILHLALQPPAIRGSVSTIRENDKQ